MMRHDFFSETDLTGVFAGRPYYGQGSTRGLETVPYAEILQAKRTCLQTGL